MFFCHACKGMWLEGDQVHRAVGAPKTLSFVSHNLSDHSTKSGRLCPGCGKHLFEHDLVSDEAVILDRCNDCGGIFLDPGEFSKFKESVAKTRLSQMMKDNERQKLREEADQSEFDPEGDAAYALQYMLGIPVEVDTRQRLFPPGVWLIILMNAVLLAGGYWNGLDAQIDSLGFRPASVLAGAHLHTLVTHMFVHAGFLHFLGNMVFLFIFGDNVEDRFGILGFWGLYLAGGLMSTLVDLAHRPLSDVPSVGASGAVSAILGIYLVLHPTAELRLRFFSYRFSSFTLDVPVYVYFGFWFAGQVYGAMMGSGNIGWWAHLGGFGAGVGMALTAKAFESRKPGTAPQRV
jgi:membrane associated rhomboid family serine protease